MSASSAWLSEALSSILSLSELNESRSTLEAGDDEDEEDDEDDDEEVVPSGPLRSSKK